MNVLEVLSEEGGEYLASSLQTLLMRRVSKRRRLIKHTNGNSKVKKEEEEEYVKIGEGSREAVEVDVVQEAKVVVELIIEPTIEIVPIS